jgi:hypothetical protein
MLTSLPSEVLSTLTSFLPAEQIDRLWACGDSLLNHKFTHQGGLTSYILEWDGIESIQEKMHVSGAQKLLEYDVHVSEFAALSSFGDIRSVILSLPSSLEKLRLVSADALTSITGVRDAVFESRPKILQNYVPVSLCERFPSLRHLELSSQVGLTTSFFDMLPMGLETLDLRGMSVALVEESLPPFPATLKQFYTDAVLVFSSLDKPRVLPDTLEVLNIHSTLQDEVLRFLPSKLKKLVLTHVGTRTRDVCPLDWKLLPSQLEHLWINRKHFKPEEMADMPRTLKYLALDASISLDDSYVPHLPPHLTKITMGYGISIKNQWKNLPRSLRWFGDGSCSSLSLDQLGELPPQLTRFDISNRDLDESSMKLLPRTILRLKLANLFDSQVPHLPPLLTHLSVQRTDCTAHGVLKWPRSIQTLLLNGPSMQTDDCFANLPQSLTQLTLRHIPGSITPKGLASLPKSITSLHIHNCTQITSDAHIAALQHHNAMRELSISGLGHEVASCVMSYALFPSLPRSLKNLYLRMDSAGYEAERLKGLPQGLNVLKIESDAMLDWTDSQLSYVPRKIMTLELPQLPNITKAALKTLPEKLGLFCANQSVPFWWSTRANTGQR